MTAAKYTFAPATAARWRDVERLFGPRGACAGCWCMWWRIPRSEFERAKGEKNKRALRAIVASGAAPGILAYAGGEPAGWCAVAPRETYPVLERSRTLARVDDAPVWSVTCFFVARAHRRRGLSVRLLRAAVEHARKCGARVVEGYPVETRTANYAAAWAWTGFTGTFVAAGFREVLRRSRTRPIMRKVIAGGRRAAASRKTPAGGRPRRR